jgi:hypothetical protein
MFVQERNFLEFNRFKEALIKFEKNKMMMYEVKSSEFLTNTKIRIRVKTLIAILLIVMYENFSKAWYNHSIFNVEKSIFRPKIKPILKSIDELNDKKKKYKIEENNEVNTFKTNNSLNAKVKRSFFPLSEDKSLTPYIGTPS